MDNQTENNAENSTLKVSFINRPHVQSIAGIIIIVLALGGFIYWKSSSSYVSIDMSQISAPMIAIGPEAEGILAEVDVKPGDIVTPNEQVARVGGEILSTKISGIVISVSNTPGQVFQPGAAVVTMINPSQLRVVGKIDEDKGLSKIHVGDKAVFTLDAFGSQQFTGVVDEISETSNQSSIVFSISDKREVKQFDVKVRYDINQYPQFKNGMSAKLRIYAK